MSEVLLFCPEPSGLTLGPSPEPGKCIQFKDGWARFDSAAFPDWEKWVNYPDSPYIEVIPPDSAETAATDDDALVCSICGKAFKAKIGLSGHMRSHAPK